MKWQLRFKNVIHFIAGESSSSTFSSFFKSSLVFLFFLSYSFLMRSRAEKYNFVPFFPWMITFPTLMGNAMTEFSFVHANLICSLIEEKKKKREQEKERKKRFDGKQKTSIDIQKGAGEWPKERKTRWKSIIKLLDRKEKRMFLKHSEHVVLYQEIIYPFLFEPP